MPLCRVSRDAEVGGATGFAPPVPTWGDPAEKCPRKATRDTLISVGMAALQSWSRRPTHCQTYAQGSLTVTDIVAEDGQTR